MKRSLLLFSVAGMLALSSCSKNESPASQDGEAKVQLVLTDAPGDYQSVNVSIKEVRINVGAAEADGVNEGASGGKWVSYPLNSNFAQPVDLLTLRNDRLMYMGEHISLPAGKISQIRLLLNETGNTVVLKDGTVQELKTPSAQQSGLKIKLNQTLVPNGIYTIKLDFDADKSVVKAGNSGQYILKPVIYAKLDSPDFGAIKGLVFPKEANTIVYLIQPGAAGPDTLAATRPEPFGSPLGEGFFKFGTIAPGNTYYISFDADNGYQDVITPTISVLGGKITDLGSTTLRK